jgi:hypothetical protein
LRSGPPPPALGRDLDTGMLRCNDLDTGMFVVVFAGLGPPRQNKFIHKPVAWNLKAGHPTIQNANAFCKSRQTIRGSTSPDAAKPSEAARPFVTPGKPSTYTNIYIYIYIIL